MSKFINAGSLRYRKPEVCEHLAGQYVAGSMTPRVRSRMEHLIAVTPELNRAVTFWADQFSDLQYQLPEQTPSADLWSSIDKRVNIAEAHSEKTANKQLDAKQKSPWGELLFWRITGVAGFVSSVLLAFFVVFTSTNVPIVTDPASLATIRSAPSYMAAMSQHNGDDDIRFVINAYSKAEGVPSRLFVQWSQRHPRADMAPLHLWAEDKDTGELSYIGVEPDKGELWNLTKPTWTAISNSSRLLMTANAQLPDQNNLVFSGPCVQLADWNKQAI
ncbi:MAG: hypothetical protein ACRBCI_09670 [Cellvibrionaceae bacterium]